MENENLNPERSHFEDIENLETCNHPEHQPPMYLCIPQGKRYIHICPACGQRVVLQPPQITLGGKFKSAEEVMTEHGLNFDWMSSKYTKSMVLMSMENYADQFKH